MINKKGQAGLVYGFYSFAFGIFALLLGIILLAVSFIFPNVGFIRILGFMWIGAAGLGILIGMILPKVMR